MAVRSLAFVFCQDRNFASPAPYLLEYVRFRHPDIPHHKVLCVQDAHTSLLTELKADDTLGEIHLYSHANEIGYVWGRLRSGDAYRGIAHTDALQFQRTDKSARALGQYGRAGTAVFVHGCNLGRFPEALRTWRDLFGGQKGKGSSPKLFQHFGLVTLRLKATWGKEVFYEKEIRHTNDVNDYVRSAVAAAKERGYRLREDAERQLRLNAEKDLDAQLAKEFALLAKGAQLPATMTGLSAAQIRAKMREVFDAHHGLPVTFLFRTLHETWWVQTGNLRQKMQPKGAVFPEDARWATYHHTEVAR